LERGFPNPPVSDFTGLAGLETRALTNGEAPDAAEYKRGVGGIPDGLAFSFAAPLSRTLPRVPHRSFDFVARFR
jgi:hypothetical protein